MENIIQEIRQKLLSLCDEQYAAFSRRLINNIAPEKVIGVRTPALRTMAKEYAKRSDISEFLEALPHKYHEENQLHAFIIGMGTDYKNVLEMTERFLPHIDNWSTCDQFSPIVFKRYRNELYSEISKWLKSGKTYTVRFGIGMLMTHFLDDCFTDETAEKVADIRSEEYYVNMMIAWFFATALAKQYDAVIPYLQKNALEVWTHNKTIQKAVESNRISDDKKAYLKTLRR